MTPERQRQEDVWVNSGEERVKLPRGLRKTFGNSHVAGFMCLPATARSRTTDRAHHLPEHSEIQFACAIFMQR